MTTSTSTGTGPDPNAVPGPADINPRQIQIERSSIAETEAPFIVEEELRASGRDLIWLKAVGGPDEKFTTKTDVKFYKMLAGLKWIAASGPAFALTEMLHGITVPLSAISTEVQTAAAFVMFGGFWKLFSEFDRLLIDGIRQNKVYRHLFGRPETDGLIDPSETKPNRAQKTFRYVLTGAGLAVTIPTLLVFANQETIENRLGPEMEANNQAVVIEYQERTDAYQDSLSVLLVQKKEIQDKIAGGVVGSYTDEEQLRIDGLAEEIARLGREIRESETDKAEAEKQRDQYKQEMANQDGGIQNGTVAGKGPLYARAKFNYDNANSEVIRLEELIADMRRDLGAAQDRSQAISDSAQARYAQGTYEDVLGDQLEEVEERIAEWEEEKPNPEEDPRFMSQPTVSRRFFAYVDHLKDNPLEGVNAIALAIILGILELGLIFSAANKPVNPAERRSAMATLALRRRDNDIQAQLKDIDDLLEIARQQKKEEIAHRQAQQRTQRQQQDDDQALQREHDTKLASNRLAFKAAQADQDIEDEEYRRQVERTLAISAIDTKTQEKITLLGAKRDLVNKAVLAVLDDPETLEKAKAGILAALELDNFGGQNGTNRTLHDIIDEVLQRAVKDKLGFAANDPGNGATDPQMFTIQ